MNCGKTFKWPNMYVIGVPKRREGEKIFEEIMAEIFSV
jgi:hypothetical protein